MTDFVEHLLIIFFDPDNVKTQMFETEESARAAAAEYAQNFDVVYVKGNFRVELF